MRIHAACCYFAVLRGRMVTVETEGTLPFEEETYEGLPGEESKVVYSTCQRNAISSENSGVESLWDMSCRMSSYLCTRQPHRASPEKR